MIDRARLLRQLEFASFAQRGQVAAEVAATATAAEVDELLDLLAHPHPHVRLGVLEVIRCAGHRDARARVLAHARAHAGDDRVFALRALVDLARPGDDDLRAAATAWSSDADAFVAAQAQRLAAAAAPAPADASGPTRAPLDQLVVRLFGAPRAAERIASVEAIERRGPAAVVATARLALVKGSADVVPLVVRALIRQAAAVAEPPTLIPLLEGARRRLRDAPAAVAALDDALLALGGLGHAPALLRRLLELEPGQVDALVARLCGLPAPEVALHVPAMLDALGRRPAMWSSLGPALAYAAADVRDGARAELRRHADLVIAELRAGRGRPPVTVVSTTWVLARVAAPGEVLPRQLRAALERLPAPEAATALVALCARLATEAAATVLVALARDPLDAARTAAQAAIAAWRSPWVELTAGEPPTVTPRYLAADGAPLARRDERLLGADGVEHVLAADGRPVVATATEHGGCRCCAPPRALVRRAGDGLRCPASWVAYLRDGAELVREDAHPHGRCRACDSLRPRVREGDRTVCLACGAGRAAVVAPPPGLPNVPVATEQQALPRPPTLAEFALVSPTIRAAMGANVFVRAHDGDDRFNASGIVIARDGDHVAILTNRHVVESDDQARLCRLEAMTVAGEARELRTVWRAARGVDLALIEGRVSDADQLAVMPLGAGAALVGAPVFAIGNPLGLPWSYSTGAVSAIRDWTSRDGLPVRVLQTDTSISPGSSGGGLWHADGHLVGVISFGHQGGHGSPVQFALSIAAVRDAFARDDLRWRGRPLTDLI
ncbi:MAG: serine protease [Myxococcales bacterium]|nr:serine protease [Myxococcales bacterium]